MKCATGPFEGFDAYDDKWFSSAIQGVSSLKFKQCISIYEEDINNLKK